jgi:CubicO group peptidase (beta-lactamase class C family)
LRILASISVIAGAMFAPIKASAQNTRLDRSVVDRIETMFLPYAREDAPGCAVGVVRDGKLDYSRGFGIADLESKVSLSSSTPFYVASTSKQFTAYSILLLAQDGKLSLDDDVRKYIPEVPDFGVPITIRHLLHHTSGLRDYFGLFALRGWRTDGAISEAEFLAMIHAQQALNFKPGARFLYNNTGYVLLSIVVRRASGQSLRDFAAARIFAPLRMASSQFRDDHRYHIRNRAVGYEPAPNGYRKSEPGFDLVGDGGLFSTVEDLARWDANLDRPTRGEQDVVDGMIVRGVLTSGDTIFYAAGLNHGMYRGVASVGHSGAYAGFRAEMLRLPAQHTSVIVLCNRSDANPTRLAQQMADIVLGDELRLAEGRLAVSTDSSPRSDIASLQRLAGDYWDDESETLTRIRFTGGRLVAVANGAMSSLAERGSLTFVIAASGSTFDFDTSAALRQVTIRRAGLPSTRSIAVDSLSPSAKRLAAMAGDYSSAELGITVRVRIEGGRATLGLLSSAATPLTPLFGNTFAAAGALIVRFASDGSGLTLSNGRTQRVRFERVFDTRY